ncbi:hypothetical protein [Candidatus Bathycorpusculum sp.]|uniref:hypothetical protein n=1 Tax=Candidatus Bathycorpusculum sp. TaxID=2994959 RepID=UPI00281E5070|nr:hypothetical protein [Candidatus Termitimicrobium sp.]MCL2685456.1 hypothetical protein [Candidatus Termitimicrobium sp.]
MTNSSNNKDGNQTMDTTNKTNEPTQQTANQTPGTTDAVIPQLCDGSRGVFFPDNDGSKRPHLHMDRPKKPTRVSFKYESGEVRHLSGSTLHPNQEIKNLEIVRKHLTDNPTHKGNLILDELTKIFG